ncbi:hypothetical protein [Streptomyces sp. NPDC056527]|uniref:hypothetical protein n=1 Tax=Streptomyces sp. NPDC056527 TaxID=3345853 RepID=UPI0036C60905
MAHLRDLIFALTRAVDGNGGHAFSRRCTGILVGLRHELALHPVHAVGTIVARSASGGGRCFHCDGTGLARPLWEPAGGQA